MSPLHLRQVSSERTIKYLFVGLCIMFFSSYAYFQARNLIHGPAITLSEEEASVQTDRTITIEGHARNAVVLRLNGREINTDENGNFEEAVVLENGYTILSLEAKDRYGRHTSLTRTFIYKPQT